jgi:hypothetical protein
MTLVWRDRGGGLWEAPAGQDAGQYVIEQLAGPPVLAAALRGQPRWEIQHAR